MATDREVVERFHLLFLRLLTSGADRTLFTLKGGCNLRFFFGSPRHSEDMDLDVSVVARDTLKRRVDKLLESPALRLPLASKGVELVDVSSPKQTETTQRWKLGLKTPGHALPLRTKVEISRRDRELSVDGAAVAVEPTDALVTRRHELPPIVAQHYVASAALGQKIEALIGRPQTQARDVFDLQLLRVRLPRLPVLRPGLKKRLPEAIDRVLSLSHGDYVSQVVAYLLPEEAEALRDEAVWSAIQLDVVQLFEELAA